MKKLLPIIIFVFVVLLIAGVVPRIQQVLDLKKMHEETTGAVPVVHTVIATLAPPTESITLPGNISAIQYATIYARASGYLTSRLVDIGNWVKTGQLLAVIDTPEIDQKLAQSKADLEEGKSNLEKAKADYKEAIAQEVSAKSEVDKEQANVDYTQITVQRWQSLCERGSVSKESRDEKVRSYKASCAQLEANRANEKAAAAKVVAAQSAVGVARASVVAREAALKRVQAEQSFQKVTAPFDGIITSRKVDPGALITAGSMTQNLELFQMAKIDTLRIYISVPQRFARYLHSGMDAQILASEYPDRIFHGTISNVSGALDPESRTLQTEVHIPNKDHALLPGMYAQVKITGFREEPTPWLRVPGTTVVTRADGQYAVVVKDGKAHYQKVYINRDFGTNIEIGSGLAVNDAVVISPSIDLQEGEAVQAIPVTTEKGPS